MPTSHDVSRTRFEVGDDQFVELVGPDALDPCGNVPVVVTLLPMGDGTHMLPVKAAVRSRLGKQAGDLVRAHLQMGGES